MEVISSSGFAGHFRLAAATHSIFTAGSVMPLARTMRMITTLRLKSPPANILRAVATPAFDYLIERHSHFWLRDGESNATQGRATKGRTADIPYSPLDQKEEAGRAAAM